MLPSLEMIRGGKQIRQEVTALLESYAAGKVITTVEKTPAEGETPAVFYTADELLNRLIDKLQAATGSDFFGDDESEGGEEGAAEGYSSIKDLSDALTALQNKKIKDAVRVTFNVAEDGTFTVPDMTTTVPGVDTAIKLPVYYTNNEPVLDENGGQIVLDLGNGQFSGTPSVLDVEASAKTEDGSMVYVPVTGAFDVKVFPVGEWTFGTIPADAMLDNEENQLLAYTSAINKIIVELAKDKNLLDKIADLVGSTAIQTVLEDYVKKDQIVTSVRDAETAADDKIASEKAVRTELDAIKASIKDNNDSANDGLEDLQEQINMINAEIVPVVKTETFEITKGQTEFVLKGLPDSNLESTRAVKLYVSGLTFVERQLAEGESVDPMVDDINVDRENGKVYWLGTVANRGVNDGFDMDPALAKYVTVEYWLGVTKRFEGDKIVFGNGTELSVEDVTGEAE